VQPSEIQLRAAAVRQNIEKVLVGKSKEIELVLTALLSNGHVLLEDAPGTGKTTLAKALAKSVDCRFKRIQFTPDLLPTDLTGLNYYSPKTGEFAFRPGGLFTNILLADEINRATPRTQSGLLECMEERQITVDSDTYPLAPPYFVIATQNPVETQGTFPLPEAQLDRFLMQLSVGYPSPEGEADIIGRFIGESPLETLSPAVSGAELVEMQKSVSGVKIHPDIRKYIVDLTRATREHETVALGVSPRGSLMLARAAQSFAAVRGRAFVTPEDVKFLAPYVYSHRLILRGVGQSDRKSQAVEDALARVPAPTEAIWS